MPKNQLQRMLFALLTVVVTVHAYVFFSLYVVHGDLFRQLTGESGVLAAIRAMGGVPVFGKPVPIWVVVLVEFTLAYTLELLLGSPLSFRLARKRFGGHLRDRGDHVPCDELSRRNPLLRLRGGVPRVHPACRLAAAGLL